MGRPAGRITIGRLMVAVAVVAGLLGLYRAFGDFALGGGLVGLFLLLLGGVSWFATRRQRIRALTWLVVVAAMADSIVALLCAFAANLGGIGLSVFVAVCVLPILLGFGSAWAVEVTGKGAARRRPPLAAWSMVVVMATLPMSMIATLWPLRLAFAISRPAMNRLADRIAAGGTLRPPEWAGMYRIKATRRDRTSGDVALLIDADPAGVSGFVRIAKPRSDSRLIVNLNFDVALGGGWRYQDED